MNGCKLVSQKKVFGAKLFDVKEVTIRLPNGAKRIHQIAQRHPTVSVFPLTDSYEIYLVSQYRYMLKKVTLEAMAGFINKDEAPLGAAKRELEEECGIVASQWEELARVEMAASVFKACAHLFLAKGLEKGVSHPDEDEDIKTIKIPLGDAVKKVMTGEINHSASMIGILLLDKLRSENKL